MAPVDASAGRPSGHTGAPAGRDGKVIGLVSAGHFFSHFYMLCLPPLFPFLQREFEVSYVALGLAMTAYNLIGGVIQAPVGFLVDRYGARHLLLAGFGLNALAVALMGLVDAYWMLLALAVFAGIGNSVFHPADYAILSGAVSERRVGRAFGIHTFSGFFGGAVAPMIIGTMAAFWGWRTALVAAGITGLAAVAALAAESRILGEAAPGSRRSGAVAATPGLRTGWPLLLAPAMLTFLLLFCAVTFTSSGLAAFTISGLVDLHGTAYGVANAALTGFLLASAFGVLLGGFLADRVGRHDLLASVFLGVAATAIVLPAFADFPAFPLILVLAASGLAFGAVQPARDMMVRAITPRTEMGKVFGFLSVGMSMGASAAPLLFGWIMDSGKPAFVFVIAGILMLATLGAALAGRFVGVRSGLGRA